MSRINTNRKRRKLVDTNSELFRMLWLHNENKVPLGFCFKLQSQPSSLQKTAECNQAINCSL